MARAFNGTSDWIAIDGARVSDGGTAFSMSVWVKSGLKTFGMVYSETNGSGSRPLFFVCQNGSSGGNGSKLELELSTAGSVDVAISSGVFFDSSWHHLGLTQNASNLLTIYRDGVQDSTFTRTANSNSSGQSMPTVRWGASQLNASTGNLYGGTLSDGATWTRTLSAAEMKALASGLRPSHLAPTHYWPLWGVDSSEPDIGTGTHVTGTLTGTSKGVGGPPTSIYLLGRGWVAIHRSTTATVTGAAALSGTGSATVAGAHTAFAAAALAGAGSSTVAGVRTRLGTAAITGAGSLVSAGFQTAAGTVAITGLGSLTAAGFQTAAGEADLAGAGSLSATGGHVIFGTSTLAATGTITVAGITIRLGAATFTGDGSLTADGAHTGIGIAALAGAGTIVATGRLQGAEAPVTTRTGSAPGTGRTGVATASGRTRSGARTGITRSTLGDN